MAGDWIKMRLDLLEDPAVIQMADKLEVREEVIVGFCHAFWSWVSRQCHDGSVTGVTLVALGRRLNLPGFPEVLVEVGWLEYHEDGGIPTIIIPRFDRHLSQGAKQRALASERKRHARVPKMSRTERDKTATREEKRREENKKETNKERCAFVKPSLEEVTAYCQERGNSVDPQAFLDHYESNGWRVGGRSPMKDWRAAVRNWERRQADNGKGPPGGGTPLSDDDYLAARKAKFGM